MDVVIADPSPLLRPGGAHLTAVGLPTATIGDAADLLDIHVNQLAGSFALVADSCGLAGPDHLAGDGVALDQARHVVAAQDPRHGARGQPQFRTQPILHATFDSPQRHHLLLGVGRGLVWAANRSRRPVDQASLAGGSKAIDPAVGALARDSHGLGRMSDRPLLTTDSINQQQPPVHGQSSITVRHEDLQKVKT